MELLQIKMSKPQQAVILCGGIGTRLKPFTNTIPKPMILCNEKPFIWYLLSQLHDEGIDRFVLLTGYLGEKIKDYFGNGSTWGWQIVYSNGPVEWDTGRRIWEAKNLFDNYFMLLYSDNFVEFSLDRLSLAHQNSNKSLTFTVSSKTPGNVELDELGIVKKYDNCRSSNFLDYVEIGYMLVEKEKTLSFYESADCSFSLILKKMSNQQEINSYIQHDSYYSISDPERWKNTERYLANKKILLIDRDGVINKKSLKGEYITNWANFHWIPETRSAMKLLAKEGFKFIVITNQAGIARQMINPNELAIIHQNMIDELLKDGIEVLDVYLCPHHWDENCNCRKPKPGMLYEASKDWLFRLDKTVFIGDDPRDSQAAFNAGCKSAFIGDTSELKNLLIEEMPHYKYTNLMDVVPTLLNHLNYKNHYDYN